MILNCDVGERGAQHPVDLELMTYIGLANIACGGHAGDAQSVAVFTAAARQRGVRVAAHLSYPDRENFGRISLDLPPDALREALDRQLDLSLEKARVKLHGALYNDCVVRGDLAAEVADWCDERGIREVVAPDASALAAACRARRIAVLAEAFAERRYTCPADSAQLVLVGRNKPYATIDDLEAAVRHSRRILREGRVEVVFEQGDGTLRTEQRPIVAQTLCVHSDSAIALPLAERLAALLREGT